MSQYDQFEIELESGDCPLRYTDALIESNDADGEMLGETGLLRIARRRGIGHNFRWCRSKFQAVRGLGNSNVFVAPPLKRI